MKHSESDCWQNYSWSYRHKTILPINMTIPINHSRAQRIHER